MSSLLFAGSFGWTLLPHTSVLPCLLSHFSLISNSFHKLLPPPAPNGLIQSQSPSQSLERAQTASLHSALPFSEHMQTLSHHCSFPNPYHTFTLGFLLTPLTTQTHCGMHNSPHGQPGHRCPPPGCFPRITLPTPQNCLSLSRLSATGTVTSGWGRRYSSSPHRNTAWFEHILGA